MDICWAQTEEIELLRSQIVTLKTGRGKHRKYLPYAFTEQGVAMLSSVLKSERAINVNIEIMRSFVKPGRCFPRTRNWPGSWPHWRRNTIFNSKQFSMPSDS
jgi:hypothetical protein